jgi:hypothetical protein
VNWKPANLATEFPLQRLIRFHSSSRWLWRKTLQFRGSSNESLDSLLIEISVQRSGGSTILTGTIGIADLVSRRFQQRRHCRATLNESS